MNGLMRKVKSRKLGFWSDLDRDEPDSYLEKNSKVRQIEAHASRYWRNSPFSVGPYIKVRHPILGDGYVLNEGLEE